MGYKLIVAEFQQCVQYKTKKNPFIHYFLPVMMFWLNNRGITTLFELKYFLWAQKRMYPRVVCTLKYCLQQSTHSELKSDKGQSED